MRLIMLLLCGILITSSFGCSSQKEKTFDCFKAHKQFIFEKLIRNYREFDYLRVGFSGSTNTVNIISKKSLESRKTSQSLSLNDTLNSEPFNNIIENMEKIGLKEFEYLKNRHFLFGIDSPTKDYLLYMSSDNIDGLVEFDEFRGALSYLEDRSSSEISPYVVHLESRWFYLKLGQTF